jgi:hypothetical protein
MAVLEPHYSYEIILILAVLSHVYTKGQLLTLSSNYFTFIRVCEILFHLTSKSFSLHPFRACAS